MTTNTTDPPPISSLLPPIAIGACNPTTTTVETDCDDIAEVGPPPTLPQTGQEVAIAGFGGLFLAAGALATLAVRR